jgi:hypothetical protein
MTKTTFKIKLLIAFTVFLFQLAYSQKLIGKDSAESIAFKGGLEHGIDSIKIDLVDNNIWEIKSLLCCGSDWKRFHLMRIDGKTGQIIVDSKSAGARWSTEGTLREKTELNNSVKIHDIPISKSTNAHYRLTTLDNENESNPSISEDNKWVAFQYGFKKIGIVKIDGSVFKHFCEECVNPQWLDRNWVLYSYDFKHIYKQNIYTSEKVKITKELCRYDDFKVSPDHKWIIYTNTEFVKTKSPKEAAENNSGGKQNVVGHTEGELSVIDYWEAEFKDIWFFKIDEPEKIKKIPMRHGQAYMPCWSKNSDSLLFYIKDKKYFATNLANDSILYYPLTSLTNLALQDYEKIRKGIFPYNFDCKVSIVDAVSLMPKNILINAYGNYDDMILSDDLKYIVFSKQDRIGSNKVLWVIRLNR